MTVIASNQDKRTWCMEYGPITERKFVAWATQTLGLDVCMNPAKNGDPYTYDLLLDRKPADLKTVRTPFYLARDLYGLDPQYTVTFNHKDGQRYRKNYPDISIMFDVVFDGSPHQMGCVQPMRLVAVGTLNQVAQAITDSGYHRHGYQQRINDTQGNAKESWLLDVRRLSVLYEMDPR